MKIIHVADLHLKMTPIVPKEWNISRYRSFIDNLIADCKDENAILSLGGDLLDSVTPLKEEIRLFMYLMHRLNKEDIPTLLVSGNHETISQGSSILDYLEVNEFPNIYYRRNIEVQGVKFHLCNHDEIRRFKPDLGKGKNVLISHFRCSIPPRIQEEIDVRTFTESYDLCLLGDIHEPLEFDNCYYSGIPINKDFQTEPKCGYLEVEIDKDIKVTRRSLDYPSLICKKTTTSALPSVKFNPRHFYKVEVEGTPEELRKIKDMPINVKLCKIPLLEESLCSKEELVEDTGSVANLDDDLVAYMKSLKYSDALIAKMVDELRRSS